jgi:hypothetical protein
MICPYDNKLTRDLSAFRYDLIERGETIALWQPDPDGAPPEPDLDGAGGQQDDARCPGDLSLSSEFAEIWQTLLGSSGDKKHSCA